MFTTSQALAVGLDRHSLGALVSAGILKHPGRALYAVASLIDEQPAAWHLHLMVGARLLYPDATFTGVSAVLAHGIDVWNTDLNRPQLTRPVKRGATHTCFHLRPTRTTEKVDTDHGPTEPLVMALVQHSMDNGIEQGVVSMDHALRVGAVTDDQLGEALAATAFWPLRGRARSAVALADGRRESVAESRCAVALAVAGIAVTPQVVIRRVDGSVIGRVDFLVDGTRVVIEVDGKVKYAAGDPSVLWTEKRREDSIRARGFVVVRITWADLERPGAVAARVRQALRAA